MYTSYNHVIQLQKDHIENTPLPASTDTFNRPTVRPHNHPNNIHKAATSFPQQNAESSKTILNLQERLLKMEKLYESLSLKYNELSLVVEKQTTFMDTQVHQITATDARLTKLESAVTSQNTFQSEVTSKLNSILEKVVSPSTGHPSYHKQPYEHVTYQDYSASAPMQDISQSELDQLEEQSSTPKNSTSHPARTPTYYHSQQPQDDIPDNVTIHKEFLPDNDEMADDSLQSTSHSTLGGFFPSWRK